VPKLVLVRGSSGAGKSTFAKTNFPQYDHFEADQYFERIVNEVNQLHNTPITYRDVFNKRDLPLAHKECQDNTLNSLKNGRNVVVSNTFTKLWEISHYIEFAKLVQNVEITIYELKTQFTNSHDVPLETVNFMKNNFEPCTDGWYKDVPLRVIVVS